MTDNLPAVRNEEPREIARQDTDSWISVVGEVAKFAGYIAGTEFVPKSLRDNPAAATAAMMYGREVGLSPMTALTQTHVIEGRPSLSAEAMRAQVIAAGHEIQWLESTGAICRVRARRRGSEEWTPEVIWTIDMARAAGLLNKSNWKNYPRRMLQARASSELIEMSFPDVTLGFRSIEEMEDLGGEEGDALMPASTKVTRKRPQAKPAALPAASTPAARSIDVPAGPPLPGEDGFDDLAPEGAAQTSAGESVGEAPDPPADPETEGAEEDRPDATTTSASPDDPAPSEPGAADAADESALPVRGDGDAAPATAGEPGPGTGRKPSRPQMKMLMASLNERGIDPEDREERLLVASKIIGRPVSSFDELDARDASLFIDTLARTRNKDELWVILDEIDAAADQGDES